MMLLQRFFFSHFSQFKKSAKLGPHSGSELIADFTPSTSSAQLEGFFIDEDGGVWMRLPSGQWTLLGSDQHVIRGHGAAAGLRGGVVLASAVLFLVHPLLDAADGGGD